MEMAQEPLRQSEVLLVLVAVGGVEWDCAGKGKGVLKFKGSMMRVGDTWDSQEAQRQDRGVGCVGHGAAGGPEGPPAPHFPLLVLLSKSSGVHRAVPEAMFSRAQCCAVGMLAPAQLD